MALRQRVARFHCGSRADLTIALLLGLSLFAWVLHRQGWPWQWREFGTFDWIAYYSTPKALLEGRGFYDSARLAEIQHSLGVTPFEVSGNRYSFVFLWNLPISLLPLLPLGGIGFADSAGLFLLISVTLYFFAALRLKSARPFHDGWLIIPLLYWPSNLALSLGVGQVEPLLTSLVIFAWLAARKNNPSAVAALIVPLILKPHLFGPAIVFLLFSHWPRVSEARRYSLGLLLLWMVLTTLLDNNWLLGWLGQGSAAQLQTVALSDLLSRYARLPNAAQLLSWPVGLLWSYLRFRKKPVTNSQYLAEAAWIGLLTTPFLWYHNLVILMAVIADICARRGWARFLLLLLPFVLRMTIPLTLFAQWFEGTVVQDRLNLLVAPIRFWLYVALLALIWLWTRWQGRGESALPVSARGAA